MTIVCPLGHAEQPADARFCSVCGTALHQTCPACGSEQIASARFCSACGLALQGDGGAGAARVDETPERRIVTVLFADLSGSTALGQHLDPEDVRALQSDLFALLHAEVEKFGGTTEKFIGDALLAVFGIPQTHEDDPERAVRAALAAHERFAAFADRVRTEHGAEVGLRIGVNTGEVVASREAAARGELMVSGDAVNVASRLQQAAEPGEVLVGERTQIATNRVVSYGPPRAIDAKGQTTSISAWTALAVPADPGPRGGGLSAPFIGRDDEIAMLDAIASRIAREHVAQLVTLFGHAGVGKSRLMAELLGRLPEARILQGRCLPYGEGITYFSLGEAAKTEAAILDTDSAEAALEKLRTAIAAVIPEPQTAGVVDAVAWTIGFEVPGSAIVTADPAYVRQALAEAWQRYIGALGLRQLTVLVVEDIHWASAALLDLLEQLAETLSETQVLILCTARPEFLDHRPTWGAGKQNATALTLVPLSPEESGRLVSSLLGEAHAPQDLRDQIQASAEGNPFFVEEMLQMLIEEGALERRNGGWAVTGRLSLIRLPDSVHGVIAARIDLLDASARSALRRCAVVGRIFWPAAVGVADDDVAPLGRRGLVSPQPQSAMAGLREFAFKHALTRDVAYGSLPRPERRELHRQVAEWIQRVAPGRGTETAELAAYHYVEAIAYGEDDPAVIRRACDTLLAAGAAAMQRGAYVAARTQLEHAARVAAEADQRAAALFALAELDAGEARWEDALVRLESAEEAQAGDPSMRSSVLALRSRVYWLTGEWDAAFESANGAVAVLAGLPESSQLARALARRSQIEMLRDRHEAIEHSRDAIAVAERVGDVFAHVNARINLFTAQGFTGAGPDAEEVLAIVETASSIGAHEEAYRAIVNFVWSAPGFLPVERVEAVIASGRHGRLPPPASIAAYLDISTAAMLLVPAGRWDEADSILAAIDVPALGVMTSLVWRPAVGGLALRRGDQARADELLADMRPLAMASGEPQRILPMAGVVLPWLFVSGREAEVRPVTEEVLDALDGHWPAVMSVDAVVRTLFAAKEFELLAVIADSLGQVARGDEASRRAISYLAANGLSALADNRTEEAVSQLAAATARYEELGLAYDSACLKQELADALDHAGETAAAAEKRREAAALFSALRCVNPF